MTQLSLQHVQSNDSSISQFNFKQDELNYSLNPDHPELYREIKKLGKKVRKLDKDITLVGEHWDVERAWHFTLGFMKALDETLPDFSQVLNDGEQKNITTRWNSVHWCKQLVNGSPDTIYPESLCQKIAQHITNLAPDDTTVTTIVGDELLHHEYLGLHGVGKGSDQPPVMAIIDYNPTGQTDAPVSTVLVGKGITFDSGGYSLKSSQAMVTMRCDMGGAATVSAALAHAIKTGLDQRVILIICSAENLIGAKAYKLGDIIHYKNGVSVEVTNTDAEGRLVLADGLIKAQEYNPNMIINAATLTGAAQVAVGTEYNALFGYNSQYTQTALAHALDCNEYLWQLPLHPWHKENLHSDFADMINTRPIPGGGKAGASIAANFLTQFLGNHQDKWLHFDLAGAFVDGSLSHLPQGATGAMVLTIAQLLHNTN